MNGNILPSASYQRSQQTKTQKSMKHEFEEVEVGGVLCLRSKRTDWVSVVAVIAGLALVGGLYGLALALSIR